MVLFTLCLFFLSVFAVQKDNLLRVYSFPPGSGEVFKPFEVDYSTEIYGKPLIVIADVSSEPIHFENDVKSKDPLPGKSFTAFYVDGLRSLNNDENSKLLYQYILKSKDPTGLVFRSSSALQESYLKNYVIKILFSITNGVKDFQNFLQNADLPVLYVAPRVEFDLYQFPIRNEIAKFSFYENSVEPFQVNNVPREQISFFPSPLSFFSTSPPFFPPYLPEILLF